MMTTRSSALPLLTGLVSSVFIPVAHAEPYGSGWYQEIQTNVRYEDNISRSYWKSDIVSDYVASISIGGGHSQKIHQTGQVVSYGYLTLEKHEEYDDIDNFGATVGINVSHQFRQGYDSAWYIGDISATVLNYRKSDAREGLLINGELSINRRLNPNSSWHLGYRYASLEFFGKSSAEESRDAAFDVTTHELYLGLDYQFLPSTFLYAEYGFRQGDAWTNVSISAGLSQYDHETADHVFDDCSTGTPGCDPRYAGSIDSDTHRLHLGLVLPIKEVAVDLSAIYLETEGDNGNTYRNWIFSTGLIWTF